jgi:TM2 domain-containing membrane protein YozV
MRRSTSRPRRACGRQVHPQRAFYSQPALGLIVPGFAQITWGQGHRGSVFLLTFISALSTILFSWGSVLGWGFFGLALVTHLVSSLDILHQRSFPVFPRITALAATSVATILFIYLPMAAVLELYAFPAHSEHSTNAGYLVNRLAYEAAEPSTGDWIWLRISPTGSSQAGLVVGVAGQEVEWTGRGWKVDGRDIALETGPFPYYPKGWHFRVPDRHVLIGPELDAARIEQMAPLVIVGRDQIVGRAWARYYPFWDRCLL